MTDAREPLASTMIRAPIAITVGEPAGIGPDLVIKLIQKGLDIPCVFIANAEMLQARAKLLGLPLSIEHWDGQPFTSSAVAEMKLLDLPLSAKVEAGVLNVRNAGYVLRCLDVAVDGCRDGRFAAMVTGPLHKAIINEAGTRFSGHTEYLQQRCEVERVVMLLASEQMKVALASTHLPLKEVAEAITQQSLTEVIDILLYDLKHKFGCQRPTVLVAGLNPHAGEGGHLGHEEIDIIEPVLQRYVGHDAELIGPLPADTLFTPKYLDSADAVLAMYHDQGLPVLKYQSFGAAVNVTLGLPIIRTSVDHGTALDLAGLGTADHGSLKCALRMAAEMAYPV